MRRRADPSVSRDWSARANLSAWTNRRGWTRWTSLSGWSARRSPSGSNVWSGRRGRSGSRGSRDRSASRSPSAAAGSSGTRSDLQYDLSELPALGQALLGGGAVLEGHDLVHDGPELAVEEQTYDVVELPAVGHGRADDVDLVPEDDADVGLGEGAGGRAAGDEPAPLAHRAEGLLHVDAPTFSMTRSTPRRPVLSETALAQSSFA